MHLITLNSLIFLSFSVHLITTTTLIFLSSLTLVNPRGLATGEPAAASWRGTRDPSFAGTSYSGGGKESIYGGKGGGKGGGGGGGGGDICYAFQKGECSRGSACKYSHDIGGSSGGGGGGGSSSSVGVGSKRPFEGGGSSSGGASSRPRHEIGGIGGMNRTR